MLWRVLRDLGGYAIGATDGAIGRVLDLRFEDRRWAVLSIVVDVGRPILLSPHAIERIDGKQRALFAGLDMARVANSPHLDTDRSGCSAWELTAHYVQGLDAEIGRVADVIVDDRTWAITHLVVAADDGLEERDVLLPVGWISWVSWDARAVVVALRSHAVHGAPRADRASPLDAGDEARVAAHYGRPPFITTR
jgi:hypothetical protein